MKNIVPKWQLSILCVFFLLPLNAQSQDNSDVIIPNDLLKVIDQIPCEFTEIDNITIRLLHSMMNPQDATACIDALPRLLKTNNMLEMDYFIKLGKMSNLIRFFEEIFGTINLDEYYTVCKTMKENNENHIFIYYILNHALLMDTVSERERKISLITELLPLQTGINPLIIASLYNNFSDGQCSEIIELLKKKYGENKSFIQEIEESNDRILYNKANKNKTATIELIP